MRKQILISLLVSGMSLLSGCYLIHPYQPDIRQGNIYTPGMVDSLRLGMSKMQVQNLLGSPVLVDPYDDSHWAYVYTYQHRGRNIDKQQLDLYFRNDRLAKMSRGDAVEVVQ